MVPSNIYSSIIKASAVASPESAPASGTSTPDPKTYSKPKSKSGSGTSTPSKSVGSNVRLPLSHTAMIPWTADFVAGLGGDGWDASRVMDVANRNAGLVYGITTD